MQQTACQRGKLADGKTWYARMRATVTCGLSMTPKPRVAPMLHKVVGLAALRIAWPLLSRTFEETAENWRTVGARTYGNVT